MRMPLVTIDRLVSTFGPVNTLIEKLSEHLLPHEVAHASGYYVYVCGSTACGIGHIHYARYLCMHISETNQNIDCVYDSCSC